MDESTLEQFSIVELKCGCVVDVSGEINQECLPHQQGNFAQ